MIEHPIDVNFVLTELLSKPHHKKTFDESLSSGTWVNMKMLGIELKRLPTNITICLYNEGVDWSISTEYYELHLNRDTFSLVRFAKTDPDQEFHKMKPVLDLIVVDYKNFTSEFFFQHSLIEDFGSIDMNTIELMKKFRRYIRAA